MENHDDRYLWDSDKEAPFPEITIVQAFLGLLKCVFFLPFTLFLIPVFLVCKFLYKNTGVKLPMLTIRKSWSLVALRLCGLHLHVKGSLSPKAGFLVCNHVSWLDILVIQSVVDVIFIAKYEVNTWPGLGFLARLADTLFVERKAQKIGYYSAEANKIMSTGDVICFFPEGTSSDGLRVLKFRSGFFEIAYSDASGDNRPSVFIQPLSLFYLPHRIDENSDFYGWWGNMSLFVNLIKVLCLSSGSVTLKFHDLLKSTKFQDRKHLAAKVERIIGDEIGKNIEKNSIKVD